MLLSQVSLELEGSIILVNKGLVVSLRDLNRRLITVASFSRYLSLLLTLMQALIFLLSVISSSFIVSNRSLVVAI